MKLELIDRKFSQDIVLTLNDGTVLSEPYNGDQDLPDGLRRLADKIEKHQAPVP